MPNYHQLKRIANARYHFHIAQDKFHRDHDGMELPDKNAAWEEASKAAGEKDVDGSSKPGHDWRMEITDRFANPIWETHVKAVKK